MLRPDSCRSARRKRGGGTYVFNDQSLKPLICQQGLVF
ncbi:hypothetical protein FH063_003875 [Azospirillum argentinense]|uniref:Uncharacterized protein n=1 Tax=Azospirillum argentinense TaxID=2970906 RepID=A0A5B0KWJ1_9PROT|nr:hypothetical protein FH063_003875 [Azospirillum argentinense]